MNAPRIVFMGTPPFAVATLNALVDAGLEVAAVVTAPDRPAGRGQQLRMSAVKERALELGLPILQPEKLKDPTFHAQLDATGATIYIVVAFRMLPEVVWTRPALGTINLHGSLLPAYRGAAPINWALINGETITGVTTFFIQQQIDTGDILMKGSLVIGPNETAGELHDRLMVLGGELMVRTVLGIASGELYAQPQIIDASAPLRSAPKLTPENCRIDWTWSAQQVHDHIRGLSPFPGAWTTWNEGAKAAQHFKVLRAVVADGPPSDAGRVTITDGKLLIGCGTGTVEALEVQAEGKRRMLASEFANGLRDVNGIALK